MSALHDQLQREIFNLQTQLQSFPPGKLIISRNQNRYKWYININNQLSYLPKKKRPLAEKLAAKRYLSKLLEEKQKELRAIDFYLKHHSLEPSSSNQLLIDSPFQELLIPYFKSHSQDIIDWLNLPFQQNENYPEQRIHKSISGNLVRSKSEILIDMALYKNKIPFRYECALMLGETTLYPDFTILHPHSKQLYYWEHFGMIDKPDYSKNVNAKLNLYYSHNIYPQVNLISTYETKDHPLCADFIEKIVEYYFL